MFWKKRSGKPFGEHDSQSQTSMDDYDFGVALEDIERNFGNRNKIPNKLDIMKPPLWLRLNSMDGLHIIYEYQWKLFREGELVWCALVQANKHLFAPSDNVDSPGNTVYSFDDDLKRDPSPMLEVASRLFSFKGEDGLTHPMVQKIADVLAHERDRAMHMPIPDLLTRNRNILFTGNMFCRKHLPDGYISTRLMPMLAIRGRKPTIIVPKWYWPESLRPVLGQL